MRLIVGNPLVLIGVTAEEWAERWDIEPFETPCLKCGAIKRVTIPFAAGQLRGLMAPLCPCGSKAETYCVVRDPKYGDLLSGGRW